MHASPQKVVNRAETPVVNRASKPAPAAHAVRANPAPSRAQQAGEGKVSSPHVARMAGSIVQRKPSMVGKADGAGSAVFKTTGLGKVAQYLAAQGAPALRRGIGNLQKQKRNEQTHDDAGEKLKQSELAVLIPRSERQSLSNSGQVNTVSTKPAPTPNENKAKNKLEQSLAAHIPKTLEDVDDFKDDKKAQLMGADVMQVVQGDKDAVNSTFKEMEQTPVPAPENTPEGLPPEELAPPTPNMNLGEGAVAPLQKEHTDVSAFTKEADSKLKEEGVTQEQLDMVDSGDLAAANTEKKGMEKAAKTEPLAVQKFAQQEAANVDKDLKQEEKKERNDLARQRKSGLGATAQKQKGTQTALEKKREEVGDKINGIFKAAQDKVKKKLADLETQSMKRFDDGNANASKEFEDNVERELDKYKDERYSGITGRLKKAKDWLVGMDDLPGVKEIFERNRNRFVTTINKLVDEITVDNKRVIQECKDELTNAKKEIKSYVDKLGPGLKSVGKKAAEEMDSKLDELDQFVNRKAEELQNKLKDKQQAAIKAIDEKIEKMKEAMAGALAKLGKLLLLAAKKFFTWALEKAGFSLAEIEGIINKGVAVLKAIFTQPIKFVKNLMNAAITGFKNFGKNFLTHLKNALFEWLTGSLQGLVLPKTWDFQGIISVALQMIGISYQNIRKHMVAVMGEPIVAGLEKTFTLVKTLITDGPMAAWEQLKEMAGEMRDAFVEAVKDFIKMKIIEQAIQWVVSLFIPGAGIIKAIIGIYDTVMFFIQKAKQIMQMIASFLGSIAEIAAGNIGAAADAMENGLARGLSLVINFLASLLRLSGITDKIRTAIQKIRDKVDAVMLKVAKWIAEKAKKLFATVFGKRDGPQPATPAGAATGEDSDKELSAVSVPFSMNGAGHKVWLEKKEGKWEIMMGSEIPGILYTKLLSAEVEVNDNIKEKVPTKVKGASWESLLQAIEKRKGDAVSIFALLKRIESKDPAKKSLQAIVAKDINTLIRKLQELGDTHGIQSLIIIRTMKHKSRFVAGDTINLSHPKLGSRDAMRGVFYGGFNSTAKSWSTGIRNTVFSPASPLAGRQDPTNPSNVLSQASYADELRWYGKTTVGGTHYATVPKDELNIDHHPEGVAKHWNITGRFTTQDKRETWYSNTNINNLRIISGSLNKSLGASEPQKELQVGPNFFGPIKPDHEMT